MNDTCSVSILRPPRSSLAQVYGNIDPSERLQSECLNDLVSTMRAMLEQAAGELGLPTNICEYQLYDRGGGTRVLDTRRSRVATRSDLLVAIEPDEQECGYVLSALRNLPLTRGLIAFLSSESRDDAMWILGAPRTMALMRKEDGAIRFGKIQRVFAMLLSPNADSQASSYLDNLSIARRALELPGNQFLPATNLDFTALHIPSASSE